MEHEGGTENVQDIPQDEVALKFQDMRSSMFGGSIREAGTRMA